jgi:hypothetical protein
MRPRIRAVKPELFNHEGLFKAETEYKLPLRLAYIGLFTCCDREGRFRWQLGRLKLAILPYDDIAIENVLEAFVACDFIKKYECEGEIFGCIPSWLRHQHINHREADSVLPSFEDSIQEEIEKSNGNNELLIDDNPNIDACSTRDLLVLHPSPACPGGREGNGRERKGRERKGSNVASVTRPSVVDPQIENIFEHWKVLMDHPNAKLDEKRKGIIGKALKLGYSVADLCQAIAGCSYTPHNIGDNDRGQRYDGLHVILRDADQIDRFIRNCKFPPRPVSEADRRSQATVHNLQSWMKRTIAEEEAYANQ